MTNSTDSNEKKTQDPEIEVRRIALDKFTYKIAKVTLPRCQCGTGMTCPVNEFSKKIWDESWAEAENEVGGLVRKDIKRSL